MVSVGAFILQIFSLVFMFGQVITAFIILLLAAFLTGIVRLFIWGPGQSYPAPITDVSVLKKGDILLTGKPSVKEAWYIQLSNVLTRKLKHRFWTHAALYQGNGKVWEAQREGVIEKELGEYLKNGFLVRAFRHKYIEDEKVLDRVIAFCADKKGCGYGMKGLIFYVFSTLVPGSFNWIFDSSLIDRWLGLDDAYFCSELVVDAFADAGFPVSPYDGWRVKPTDFISNPLLACVEPR